MQKKASQIWTKTDKNGKKKKGKEGKNMKKQCNLERKERKIYPIL